MRVNFGAMAKGSTSKLAAALRPRPSKRNGRANLRMNRKIKDGSLPVINIHPEKNERGDSERETINYMRTDADVKGDFSVNIDPSSQTNEVPENDPPYGVIGHPAAAAISSEGKYTETGPTKNTLGDEVAAVTNATKRTGATLPKSMDKSLPNIMREAAMAQIQQNETKNEIKTPAATGSLSPEGTAAAGTEAKSINNQQGPSDSAVSTVQAQKASNADTLRPMFGMANPLEAVPSTREQIKSGILFNDFHIVAPGYGLGATNKMFLMNELREHKIRYREPLAFPRADIGPTNNVLQPPLEFQNSITKKDLETITQQKMLSHSLALMAELQVGEGSLNTLGDDYGLLRSSSAKGLPRPRESVFEPVILKPAAMERARVPAGSQFARRETRRLFDAERWPEHFDRNMGMEGGAHYGRRNALRLLPFPLGMA